MKQEIKIPKGWRRGNTAISPQPKPVPKVEPPVIKEVLDVVQPTAKGDEERETKNKKGKKEKVVEPVTSREVFEKPSPEEVAAVEGGEIKNGDD